MNRTGRFYRRYATTAQQKPKSLLYGEIFPAMIPICLLGSAIYLGLQLTRMSLAHEKYMDEAEQRVAQLEARIQYLQQDYPTKK